MAKLIAYCTACGAPQGKFANEGELKLKIAEIKKCESCAANFCFLSDGRIWNLRWEIISNEEMEVNSAHDFWNLIHGTIINIAKERFEDGYYADAVESAFKEINKLIKDIVKRKTDRELDGADLMFKAFKINDPVILLSELSSETGKNIQEGYMYIFAGSMKGIRNPKAHENITISREKAIHFIFLASLLMHKLDEAK